MQFQDVHSGYPLKGEGVKVTSCLVTSEELARRSQHINLRWPRWSSLTGHKWSTLSGHRGAWSVNREPMDKNRIEGAAKQGERASIREALVTKAKRRRCGGCAMKVCVLTWGDLASCLKGRQRMLERGVSRGRSSASSGSMRQEPKHEGPNESE